MKLNYKSIFTAIALMTFGANANAGLVFDWYAGANASLGGAMVYSSNNRFNNHSQSYGAVFGMDFPVVRFEAEYNYVDSEHLDMSLAMGNAYVKLPGYAVINPYIGVGVGILLNAKTDYHTVNIDPNVAYQGMLGATISIPTLPFKIDVEGRALLAPEMYSVTNQTFHAMQYDARVKLRYIF